MNRPFLKQILIGAFVYVSAVLVLETFVFVLSHIPPTAANLDPLIAPIAKLEAALLWTKQLLRSLWQGETTPRLLLWVVMLLNWLLWGCFLAFLWRGWQRLSD